MMSCQVRLASEQTAEPRSIRPGPETPASEGSFRRPDLLERRPVVGRALVPEEPGSVMALERDAHLQAAPVGVAGVRPAPLVAVDAEPIPQVRRVLGPNPRRFRP